MTSPLSLNPALNAGELAKRFALQGRIHVPDILAGQGAMQVHQALTSDAPWMKCVRAGGDGGDVPMVDWEGMSAQTRANWNQLLTDGADKDLQFQFDSWRVSDAIEAGRRVGGTLAPVEAVYDLLNSDAFLDFIRDLTGGPRGDFCDAQATRYRPGDFLAQHHDEVPGLNRLFAYVLNLTPVWQADWGGTLIFVGEDGHVDQGFSPAFNALNLFRVPTRHAVTQVASYAAAHRLAITGWVRARA